jgi:purine-binding chemotaxis protein CheW
MMSVLTAKEKSTYLSFCLAEDMFALEVGYVREVLDMAELTRIPRMPEYMRGVINLRGSVVPIIDMRLKFGMESVTTTVDTCIIVVEAFLCGQPTEIGILVDSVRAVCEIREEDIEPPPSIGMNLDSSYLKGIGKQEEGFIIILDLDRIFPDEDLPVMEDQRMTETVSEGVVIEI